MCTQINLFMIHSSLSLFHLTHRFGVSWLTTNSFNINFLYNFCLSLVCVSFMDFYFLFPFFLKFQFILVFVVSHAQDCSNNIFSSYFSFNIRDFKNSFFLGVIVIIIEFPRSRSFEMSWSAFMAHQSMNYEILALVTRSWKGSYWLSVGKKQLINLNLCRVNACNWVFEAVMNLLMLINLS